jgi:hypothetical protein
MDGITPGANHSACIGKFNRYMGYRRITNSIALCGQITWDRIYHAAKRTSAPVQDIVIPLPAAPAR